MALLLFFPNIQNSYGKEKYFITDSDIYYETPWFDLENMNLTLAASFPFERSLRTPATASTAIGAAIAVCQADFINQKLYPEVNFNGTINIAIQSYGSDDSVGQYSTIKLLSNSLYNSTSGQALTSSEIFNIAGYFGVTSSGINRINSAALTGYAIPFINPGTIDQADVEDNFAISNYAEIRRFYDVRDTSLYTSFNVLLDLMSAYNWSICSNIFQDNMFGFAAQQYVQIYSTLNQNPIFTCNRIFTPNEKDNSDFVQEICNCWANIDILRIVSLWTDPITAFNLIREFRAKCKIAKNIIFIVSGVSEPLPSQIYYNTEDFKTTLIIRTFGPLNVTSYLSKCLQVSNPQARTVINELIDFNLEKQFNCFRKNDSNSYLPACPTSLFNRIEPCLCTGSEYNPEENPFAVSLTFLYFSTFINLIFRRKTSSMRIQYLHMQTS